MDFYLASDSSLAIHSKTIAKVRKRIGICKKIGKFLANPNKIGYIQGFCPYRGARLQHPNTQGCCPGLGASTLYLSATRR